MAGYRDVVIVHRLFLGEFQSLFLHVRIRQIAALAVIIPRRIIRACAAVSDQRLTIGVLKTHATNGGIHIVHHGQTTQIRICCNVLQQILHIFRTHAAAIFFALQAATFQHIVDDRAD